MRTSLREKLHEDWQRFKESDPGCRFQDRYHRHQAAGRDASGRGRSSMRRIVNAGIGFAVAGAGIVMLVAPGPGIAALVIGLGLVAGESLLVARMLDWSEVQLRRLGRWSLRLWRRMSVPLRVGTGLVVLVAAASAAYGLYVLVFGNPS